KVDGDVEGTTDSNGKLTFTRCGETVIITVSKSGYTYDYTSATLASCSLCVQPSLECTLNSECNTDEFCSNNVCEQITGTCGYITNHAWVSYECCSASDCDINQKCTEHVCVNVQPPIQNDTTLENAQSAISEAEAAISDALAEGKDVTNAQNKLAEAKSAFAEGDFDSATKLANWATNFADAATNNLDNESVVVPQTPQPEPEPQPKTDFGILLLLIPIVVVVGLVALYLAFGTKK
ncbi:MAG: DUF4398 domain-containing protein, partial [Candidatus Micrarchaeota archaeon]